MPTGRAPLLDRLDQGVREARRALPAISIALILLLVSAPGVWNSADPASLVLWVLMCTAGGISVMHPVPASLTLGGILTLAVTVPNLTIGLGIFGCLVAFASCVIFSRPLTSLLIGIWYAALLIVATFSEAKTLADILAGAGIWLVLLGVTAAIGVMVRVLGWRLGESGRKRVEDLAAQRRALSRELHDTAIRTTTEVVMIAEQARLRPGLDPATDRDLMRISASARSAAEDLRAAMDALRRSEEGAEDPLTLPAVEGRELLQTPHQRLTEAGFRVNIDVEGTRSVPGQLAVPLAMCLNELVANVIRHGERSQPVGLMLETSPDGIDIVVVNRKADAAPSLPSGGSGLIGTRERIAQIGGSVDTRTDGGSFMARLNAPLPQESS